MDINAIVKAYKANALTADEANKALAEAGAPFRFDPDKAGRGWTEAEMAAGFKPGDPAVEVPDKPDMSRREELAGLTVAQRTRGGIYDVTYDDLGYAVKAVKR